MRRVEVLLRNNLTPVDIGAFIPHQANKRIITATADRLGIPPERVILNIGQYGNTTAATIPWRRATPSPRKAERGPGPVCRRWSRLYGRCQPLALGDGMTVEVRLRLVAIPASNRFAISNGSVAGESVIVELRRGEHGFGEGGADARHFIRPRRGVELAELKERLVRLLEAGSSPPMKSPAISNESRRTPSPAPAWRAPAGTFTARSKASRCGKCSARIAVRCLRE
jgi:hypothetical protein